MTSIIGYSNTQYDAINTLNTRIATLKATIDANKVATDNSFVAINTLNTTQDTRLQGLTGAFATTTTAQAASSTLIGALETAKGVLEGNASTNEGKQGNLNTQFSSYDTRVATINSDITGAVQDALDLKGNTGVYSGLASQVTTIDSTTSAAIALRVQQTAQAAVDASQDALQVAYGARIEAIVEFVKAFEKTYIINKPNGGGSYTFELSTIQDCDKLAPSIKIINLLNKKSLNTADWGLTLKLSEYGFNQLLGKVSVSYVSGTPGVTAKKVAAKADFNPTTREVVLSLDGVRDGVAVGNNLVFPFNIQYEDVKGQPLFSVAVTQADFAALTAV